MKKIVLNISDCTFEKLRFEALHEKKSIQEIVTQRLIEKPFSNEVEEAYDKYFRECYYKLTYGKSPEEK